MGLKSVHTSYYVVTVYLIENVTFIHYELSNVEMHHCSFVHDFNCEQILGILFTTQYDTTVGTPT